MIAPNTIDRRLLANRSTPTSCEWWLDDPQQVCQHRAKRHARSNQSNSIVISAVVPWELAIKTNIGKLQRHRFLGKLG